MALLQNDFKRLLAFHSISQIGYIIVGIGISLYSSDLNGDLGLVGALLVLGSDMIGQFVFSTRFPVGVITGILGAPYMLFLLIGINRRGES